MRSRDLVTIVLFVGAWTTSYDITNGQASGSTCPPMDLYFMVETSVVTSSSGFNQAMFFIKKVVESFIISPSYTQVSLTLFNNTVRDVFDLNTYSNRRDLMDALTPSLYRREKTAMSANVGRAMQWMVDNKFVEDRGQRSNVSALCVLIIEGRSGDNIRTAAANLDKHCRIIAIGINRADFFQLINIASEPSIGHVKTLLRYSDLSRQAKWLTEVVCVPPLVSPRLKRTASLPDALIISWEDQEFALSYVVTIRRSDSKLILQTRNITKIATMVEFQGLEQATTYLINAWGVGINNKEGPHATLFSTTALQTPTIAMNESLLTPHSAMIYWEKNKVVKGVNYFVTVRKISDNTVVNTKGTFDTVYFIRKLQPGTGYVVDVKSLNAGISSQPSNKIEFYTVPATPNVVVNYASSIAVRISWDQVPGAVGYIVRVYDAEPGKDNFQILQDIVTENSVHIQPLISGTLYRFIVTAQNHEGRESVPSKEVLKQTAPGNPILFAVEEITTNSMLIKWNPAKSALKYRLVYQRDDSGFVGATKFETPETSYRLTHLRSGSRYQIQIQSFGVSDVTDERTITPQIVYTAPDKISRVFVRDAAMNTVQLDWTDVFGAVSYDVEFRPSDVDIQVGFEPKIVVVNDTILLMTELSSGVRYGITVTPITENGVKRNGSNIVYATTIPAVPTKPILVSSTNSTLNIEWNEVKGAISYIVSQRREGRTQWLPTTVKETKFNLQFLRDGTFYEFAIRSVGTGNKINNELSEVLRVQTVPFLPEQLFAISSTTENIVVRWSPSRGAAYYIVNMESVDIFSFVSDRSVKTNETIFTLDALNPGEAYTVNVQAAGIDEVASPNSLSVTETTLPATPGQPEALDIRTTTVTLEWEQIHGAEAYVLTAEYDDIVQTFESNENKFEVTGLSAGTWVDFSIQSMGTRRRINQNRSEKLRVQTAPAVPKNFAISSSNMNSVSLSWEPVVGVFNFVLQYKSVGEDEGFDDGQMTVSGTSTTVEGLRTGVTYEFVMYAIGSGRGRSDDTPILTETTMPVTPGIPQITNVAADSISLKWIPVKGAQSYIVVARNGPDVVEAKSLIEEIILSPLKPGNFYDFSLKSVGSRNRINPTESFSVSMQTLPGTPANISLSGSTTNSISLTWNKLDGVQFYSIEIRDSKDFLVKVEDSTESMIIIEDLQPGHFYTFVIIATSESDKTGASSEPFGVTTVPDVPKQPVIVEMTQNTAELIWDDVIGAVKYIVITRGREEGTETRSNTSIASTTLSNLKSGYWYEFTVQSVGSNHRINDQESEMISDQTVTINPSNIVLDNETTTELQISWDKVVGAKEYMVLMKYLSNINQSDVTEVVTDTQYYVNELLPGNSFSFQISAIAENGLKSFPSEEFIAATMTDIPSTPHVHDTSNTSLSLEWKSIIGAVRYVVFISDADGDGSDERQADSLESHIVINDLIPGTWYNIYLKSVGRSGRMSNPSPIIKGQTVPSSEKKINITAVGNDFMDLSWEPIKGVVKYFIDIEWFDPIKGTSENVIETTEPNILLTGLISGIEYDVHIKILSESGVITDLDMVVHEKTLASTPDLPVRTNVTYSSIYVEWEPVIGGISYIVQLRDELGELKSFITNEKMFVFVGLKAGSMFNISLLSLDFKNRTNNVESEILIVQTIPKQPEQLTLSTFTPTSMQLSWPQPKGAYFYLVILEWISDDQQGDLNREIWSKLERLNTDKWDIETSSEHEVYSVDGRNVEAVEGLSTYFFQTTSSSISVDGLISGTNYLIKVKSVGVQNEVSPDFVTAEDYTVPATTRNVEVSNITTSSMVFIWESVKGFEAFIVNQTQVENGNTITYSVAETSVVLNNLQTGTYYDIVVYSVGKSDRINLQGTEPITVQTFPDKVSELNAVEITTTTIALEWSSIKGSQQYEITTKYANNSATVRVDNSTVNNITLDGLVEGESYLILIQAISTSSDRSEISDTLTVTTVPLPPSDLTVLEVTENTISIDWNDVLGAVKYNVLISNGDLTKYEHITSESSFKLQNLQAGSYYTILVQSIGEEDRLNEIPSPSVTHQTVPLPPSNIEVASVETKAITIKWDHVKGMDHYEMTIVEDRNPLNVIKHQTTNSNFTILNLSSGLLYSISMVTISTSNKTSKSSDSMAVATVPNKVVNFHIEDVKISLIHISWENIVGAQQYEVAVKVFDGLSATPVQTVTTEENNYKFSKLISGILYTFEVTSTGLQNRTSETSSPFTVQTIPKKPSRPIVKEITNISSVVSWKPVVGADSYRISLTDVLVGTLEIFNSNLENITLNTLKPGTNYNLYLQSIGERAQVVISEQSDETQIYTVPPSPTGWRAMEVTPTSIRVQWNPVIGGANYNVRLRLNDDVNKRTRASQITKDLNIQFDDLKPGIYYDFTVNAIGEDGKESVLLPTDKLIVQTIPHVVSGVVSTNVTESSFTLQWSPVKGILKYIVTCVEDESIVTKKIETEIETATFTKLLPGLWYECTIESSGVSGVNPETSIPLREQTISLKTGGMYFSDIATTTLSIQWTSTIGAKSYDVYVREFNSTKVVQIASSDVNNVTITSLTPGTRYSFSIISVSSSDKESAESDLKTATMLISPTESKALKNVSPTSVSVEWDKVSGAVDYIVILKENETDFEQTQHTEDEKITIENLQSGTWYTIAIKSVGSSNIESPESDEFFVQTTPAAPTGLLIDDVMTDSIMMHWDDVSGAYSYLTVAYFELQSKKGAKEVRRSWESFEPNVVLDGLQPGLDFRISVIAIGDLKNSAESEIIFENTLPHTPTKLQAKSVTPTSMTLLWTEMEGAFTYEVDMIRTDVSEVKDFTTNQSSLIVNELAPGGTYDISVLSLDIKGRSNNFPTETLTIQTIPLPPAGLSSVNVSLTSITVSWEISYGSVNNSVSVEWSNNKAKEKLSLITSQNNIDINLPLPGTIYRIKVNSIGTHFTSEWSEELQENTLPTLPSEVEIGKVTTSSIQTKWEDVKGSDKYAIRLVEVVDNVPSEELLFANSSSLLLTNLTSGQYYNISLYTIDAQNRPTFDETEVVTVQTVVSAPVGLQTIAKTVQNMTIEWDPTFGAKSYLVIVRHEEKRTVTRRFDVEGGTSILLSLPLPGIDYEITVVAIGDDDRSVESEVLLDHTLLEVPRIPDVISVTTTEFELEWNKIEGAQGYHVLVTRIDVAEKFNKTVEIPTATISNLTPGGYYEITIISFDFTDRAGEFGSIPIQIQTVPQQPQNFTITDVTTTAITFSWPDVYGVDDYLLTVSGKEENILTPDTVRPGHTIHNGLAKFELNVSESSAQIRRLGPGSSYRFSVVAIGKYQAERVSSILEFRESTLPLTPNTPALVNVTTYTAILNWDVVTGGSFYQVLYNVKGDDTINITQTKSMPVTLKLLKPATWYKAQVSSHDKFNRTNNRKTPFIEFQTVTEVTENITVHDVTTNTISISWPSLYGAVSYIVDVYWLQSEEELEDISIKKTATEEKSLTLSTQKTDQAIENLVPGTQYWITVSSLSESGRRSPASDRITERTIPFIPGGPEITFVGKVRAVLEWKSVKGAIRYKVVIQSKDNKTDHLEYEVKRNMSSTNELTPGTVYEATVHSIGEKERINENPSQVITFKTTPLESTNVTVTNVLATSITLAWIPPKGGTHFRVIAEFDDGSKQRSVSKDSSQPTITLEELSSGTVHTIYVITFGSAQMLRQSGKSHGVVQRTVPAAPIGLMINAVKTDSMQFAWNPSFGATSYLVRYVNETTLEKFSIDAKNNLKRTVNNIVPGTVYRLTVQALNAAEELTSLSSIILPQRTLPLPPSFINGTNVGQDYVVLRWDEPVGMFEYNISVYEVPEGGKRRLVKVLDKIKLNRHRIEELEPGTKYEFDIITLTIEGLYSAKSEPYEKKTAPATAQNLNTKFVETISIELEWDAAKGATAYMVYLKNTISDDVTDFYVMEGTSLFISDLHPGTRYSMTVRSLDESIDLESTLSEVHFQSTRPLAPSELLFDKITSNSLNMMWDDVFGTDKYIIRISSVKSGTSSPIRKSETEGENSLLVDNLNPGTRYEFDVQAITADGVESRRSQNIRQFTKPNTPVIREIDNVETTSFSVSWRATAGAVSYIIKVVNEENLEEKNFITGNVLVSEVTGLVPGTLYTISLRSVTAGDGLESLESDTAQQRTLPTSPGDFVVSNVESEEISLEWEPVIGAISYTMFITELPEFEGVGKPSTRILRSILGNKIQVNRLKPGTQYEFEMIGVSKEGLESSRSNIIYQRTIPQAPLSVSITTVEDMNIKVGWRRVKGASSYVLTVINRETLEERKVFSGDEISAIIVDLAPGTVYSIAIQAQVQSENLISKASRPVVQKTLPAQPSGIYASDVTENSIILKWADKKGATNYVVYPFEVSSTTGRRHKGSAMREVKVREPEVTIKRLQPGQEYEFEIIAITVEGLQSKRSEIFRQRTRFPAPVMQPFNKSPITFSNVGKVSMTVAWPEVKHAEKYTLVIRSDFEPERLIRELKERKYEITRLTSDTSYRVTFFAVGKSGDESKESLPVGRQMTRPEAPETPQNLRVTNVTHDSLLLQWDEAARVNYYIVRTRDTVNNKIKTNRVTENRRPFIDLVTDRVLMFTVISVGKFENSSWTSTVKGKAQYPVPQMPDDPSQSPITVTDISWNYFTISFPALEHATSYTVRIKYKDGKLFKEFENLRETSLKVTGVEQATPYYVTYRAFGNGGVKSTESKPSLIVETRARTPETPRSVTVTNVGADTATVSWPPAIRALSYKVQFLPTPVGVPVVFDNVKSPFNATGLSFSTTYEVSVSAVGQYDYSPYSPSKLIKTIFPSAGDVSTVEVEFLSDSSIWLAWPPAPYALSYTVTVMLNNKVVKQHTVIPNKYRLEGMQPATTYRIGISSKGYKTVKSTTAWRYIKTMNSPRSRVSSPVTSSRGHTSFMQFNGAISTQPSVELKSSLQKMVGQMMKASPVVVETSLFKQNFAKSIDDVEAAVMKSIAPRTSPIVKSSVQSGSGVGGMEELLSMSKNMKARLNEDGYETVSTQMANILTGMFVSDSSGTARSSSLRSMLKSELSEILKTYTEELTLYVTNTTDSTVSVLVAGVPSNLVLDVRIRYKLNRRTVNYKRLGQGENKLIFSNLMDSTEYEIILVNKLNGQVIQSKVAKTTSPAAGGDLPPTPTGLSRGYVSYSMIGIRWNPVRIPGVVVTFTVRVYDEFSSTPTGTYKNIQKHTFYISKLRRRQGYYFTVSTYNPRTQTESFESKQLYVKTR